MPWCPKCGAEYVPGCIVCADCQAPLVDKLSEPGDDACSDQAEDRGEWKLLLNVRNSSEANLLVARLEGEGIPVLKQAQGAGQYLEVAMGSANDIDLYVPEAYWPQAQSLLSDAGAPVAMGSANKAAAPTTVPIATTTARRNIGRNLLIALMLVPILIYLCTTVYSALIGVWKSLF